MPERKGTLRFAWIALLVIAVLAVAGLALRVPLRDVLDGNRAKTEMTQGTTHSETSQPPVAESQAPPAETNSTPLPVQPESGTLAFEAQNQKLGEETYRLERLPTGEYKLSSSGFFSLKVFAADVKFDYTQEILTDADLRPTSFSLDFHGPLGLGNRSTKVEIDGVRAQISTDNKPREVEVPEERFAILGMFSSYALATKLMVGGQTAHLMAFIAAGFESPGEKAQDSSPLLFPLEFTKLPPLKIRDIATSQEREVEEYLLKLVRDREKDPQGSDDVGLRLLVANGEFLGLIAASPDEKQGSFKIYRIDLFPKGIEIVSTSDPLPKEI